MSLYLKHPLLNATCAQTDVPGPKVLPDSALPAMSPGFVEGEGAGASGNNSAESLSPGDVVGGTIDLAMKAWAPPCLMVRLDGGGVGRVCVTEVAKEEAWKTRPFNR